MIQAFGYIDSTHIPIKTIPEDSQHYFNCKQFHSCNVRAIHEYSGYFHDAERIWPGSCHKEKVFSNSDIARKMRNKELPETYTVKAL